MPETRTALGRSALCTTSIYSGLGPLMYRGRLQMSHANPFQLLSLSGVSFTHARSSTHELSPFFSFVLQFSFAVLLPNNPRCPKYNPRFSNARRGYWSVSLEETPSYFTTLNSPFGRYRFERLPFGLTMSQDMFQERIDHILSAAQEPWVSPKTLQCSGNMRRKIMRTCTTP